MPCWQMLLTSLAAWCLERERLTNAAFAFALDPQALKHNNFPTIDHGIETLYRFAGFDPWDRSSCGCSCSCAQSAAAVAAVLPAREPASSSVPYCTCLPNCCCLPLSLLPRRLWGQPRPGPGALAGLQPAEIVAASVCSALLSWLVLHQSLALFAACLPAIKLPTTHCLLPAV